MRTSIVLVCLAALFTGCDKKSPPSAAAPTNPLAKPAAAAPAKNPLAKPEAPPMPKQAWTPIKSGKDIRFAGVEANVPGTWNIVPNGNSTLVAPGDANQMNEIYGFVGEPSLKTLDAPGLEPYLDNAVMQLLQVPAQRAGPGESVKVGALEGKTWKWTATLMDGRQAEVRSWAFVGSYAGSFVAITTPDTLKRRMPEIESILASIHKPAAAAITPAQLCNTWVRAFGSGSVLIGNANEQRITFDASGRFQYHSEGTSHGLFHTGSSQTDLGGTWQLNGDQLTGRADTGETATFTLEARDEAGTGAAVIAIDGTEFRQIDGRRWK